MLPITLPPELEDALSQSACAQGTTPELLALDSLRERLVPAMPSESVRPQEDYWDGFIGVIDSSETFPDGSSLSENAGKKFAEGMVEKREQGKL